MKKTRKAKILQKINFLKKIIFCSIIVLFKEIILAMLPVLLIIFICVLAHFPYPYASIYNNLFVGCTTLNMGNMMYLFIKYKDYSKELIIVLFIASFFSFGASLAGTVMICLEDMEKISFSYDMTFIKISAFLSVSVLLVEILKIIDEIKE